MTQTWYTNGSLLLGFHRTRNPRSRAVGLLRYARNTTATKQLECVLCGERGPSWCSRYPETKRAKDWACEHEACHIETYNLTLDETCEAMQWLDAHMPHLGISHHP